MSWYLLDADAVIDDLKGVPSTAEFLVELQRQGHTLCSCDIVIAEVYAGLPPAIRQSPPPILDALQFLTTTEFAAQRAGIWRYDFARRGTALSITDALIAAVAFDHGASVVTGNVRDYPMPGVSVVPLPRARRSNGT